MGAYLSEPNVEKISEDGGSERLSYGVSAMQGWRVAMEDSHNCITKLGDDTSMFAVYDGHGGADVALYTAQELPRLLLELEAYKNGDLEGALQEAFMKFDASLKQKSVIEKLRRLAGIEESEEKEEDGETETLLEEASLPLEQLVARYCSHPSKGKRARLKETHQADLLSPVIQKKQPRFPLTAVNGSLQDGDGPVPNKTVPFDEEGDVMPKVQRDCGADGDGKKREGANGTNSDDDDEEEEEEKGAEHKKEEEEPVKMEAEQSKNGEGSSGNGEEGASTSGGCNGGAQHSTTKDSGSTSGSSLGNKLKEINSDDDEDSDESDEDYQSEEEEEEEDDEEEDDEEEGEEEDERGDYDEEEDFLTMQSGRDEPGSDSGTTAVVAILRGRELMVANIGDSRCVLSRGGAAVDMSYDHKPEDDAELTRIERAGGKVTPDGRVNGGLNLSRAFGDHCYKLTKSLPPEEQMISAYPEIQTANLADEDEFMVVACDGIWNAMTSQEVIDFVQTRLDRSQDSDQANKLSKICEEMFDFCLSPDTSGDGTGCDNMTCMVVQFHFDGKQSIGAASVGGKRKSAEDEQDENESKKPRH